MSRSYCKVRQFKEVDVNKSFRVRDLMCIRMEAKNHDFGEVVFPVFKECVRVWGRGHKPPVSKKEIRDGYFLEIRNILNGYTHHSCYRNYDPEEGLIAIYKIKGLIPDDGRKYKFEWLNLKRIQNVIKTWAGEPLEVLKELTDNGLIEEAVCREFKLGTRK